VVYLGDTGRLFTTGFSKFSDRQYAVWSQNDLSQPLEVENIDSSSGKRVYEAIIMNVSNNVKIN